MKKVIRLTEGELTNLIKRILKEDSTTNNCHKEYRNPESSADPYIYRMGPECNWETKSDKSKKQIRRVIDNWESLYKNKKANEILDKWFPNAKSDCSKCKKQTTTTNNELGDCPLSINCMAGAWNRPKLCDNPEALQMCVKKGTLVFY